MLCVMGDRVQSHSQSDTGDVLDRAVEMTREMDLNCTRMTVTRAQPC